MECNNLVLLCGSFVSLVLVPCSIDVERKTEVDERSQVASFASSNDFRSGSKKLLMVLKQIFVINELMPYLLDLVFRRLIKIIDSVQLQEAQRALKSKLTAVRILVVHVLITR